MVKWGANKDYKTKNISKTNLGLFKTLIWYSVLYGNSKAGNDNCQSMSIIIKNWPRLTKQ